MPRVIFPRLTLIPHADVTSPIAIELEGSDLLRLVPGRVPGHVEPIIDRRSVPSWNSFSNEMSFHVPTNFARSSAVVLCPPRTMT
jgi:hypothetical protein